MAFWGAALEVSGCRVFFEDVSVVGVAELGVSFEEPVLDVEVDLLTVVVVTVSGFGLSDVGRDVRECVSG